MKKVIVATAVLFVMQAVMAQSVDEARQHLYYQRYHSAASTFEAITAKDAKNDEAWYGLTKAYLLQDETDKARQALANAPQPVHDEAYYFVAQGEIALRDNKPEEAAAFFQRALDKTKNKNPNVMLAVAKAHTDAQNGNAGYAVEVLNKAIERDDKNPALYVALGDAYRKAGNSNEGYKAYRQALNINAGYAPALYSIGDIFLSQRNRDMYVDYFTQAANADPAYAPALYRLYLYNFSYHPDKAMDYYSRYMANADKGLQNEYDLADLNYLNKDYKAAIDKANSIVAQHAEKVKPRIYKLIGYSYAAMEDSARALQAMHRYFANESDSNYVAKDFDMMAKLYMANGARMDSASYAYERALALVQDSAELYPYYNELAQLAKEQKDFASEAKWMEQYYTGNNRATNVDLFNWALAHYRAEEYEAADRVFGMYTEKYPDQSYGFYWRARVNAARDEGMKEGLAVPHYHSLIEVLEKEDMSDNNKRWMLEAYNYLAAYETNTAKNYNEAIEYFDKVLELNPEDADAKKYKAMLEKTVSGTSSR